MLALVSGFGLCAGGQGAYTAFLEVARDNGVPAFVGALSGSGVLSWRMGENWSWRLVPGYLRTSITVEKTDITLEEYYLGAGPCFNRGANYWGGLFSVTGFGLVLRGIDVDIELPHYGGFGAELYAGRRLWKPLVGELQISGSIFPVRVSDPSDPGRKNREKFYGFGFVGVELGLMFGQ